MIRPWVGFCARFRADQQGAAGIDYVLLAALVSLGMFLGVVLFGDSLRELFTTVADTINEIVFGR